jgi:CBS domain containing-hemolysin-like protein
VDEALGDALSSSEAPFYLLLAFALIGGNAFFVMAEFAIVKVRASRIEEMAHSGLPGSARAREIVGSLDEYLSAVQLGITMVSLGLGWVGERAFAPAFMSILSALGPLRAPTAHAAALAAAFAAITMLHVVLGEQVPKLAAIRRPGLIARLFASPLWVFRTLFFPVLWVLNAASIAVLRLVGVRNVHEPGISEAELRIMFADSFRRGVITSSEAEIMERATRFSDRSARDVMVPLDRVIVWSLARTVGENLAVARDNKHTRYPVLDPVRGDFTGVINLKALALLTEAEAAQVQESDVIKPLLRVPAERRIDAVLAQMRRRRQHMAAVNGPGGHAIGILTMEDIIEEIFGEIEDEFDSEETTVSRPAESR